MGGGDFTERQVEQRAILDKAYKDISPPRAPARERAVRAIPSVEVPKPDIFDKTYVMLRTVVPGWMMGLFIVVGAITMSMVCFRKQIKGLISMWGEFLKWKKMK